MSPSPFLWHGSRPNCKTNTKERKKKVIKKEVKQEEEKRNVAFPVLWFVFSRYEVARVVYGPLIK